MTIIVARPDELTATDRAGFIAFVRAAREVNAATLPALVDAAFALITIHAEGKLIGTAAIKNPDIGYHADVFAKAGIGEQAKDYALELGWVHVQADCEGRGHGRALIAAAIEAAGGAAIYATTKSATMHYLLPQYGFEPAGNPYPSTQVKGENISVFVRATATADSVSGNEA